MAVEAERDERLIDLPPQGHIYIFLTCQIPSKQTSSKHPAGK